MLCEKCAKNNATTHIRTVVNGIVKELNLCASCASKEGYATLSHNSLAGMLASMFGDVVNTGISDEIRCPVCSSTFSDIAKTGKMGCAECYNSFGEKLYPYLKRVHGSTKHIGKVPNSAPLTVVPAKETAEALRMRLNELIREEKYEEAAVVRDKIKKLEGEANE